jgi:hypothetical protein
MAFVNFDVYSAQPLGLNGDDVPALAEIVERMDGQPLAYKIRHGLPTSTLVELDEDERQLLVDALDELMPSAANQEQVEALARNLRLRIAGGDIPTPPVE